MRAYADTLLDAASRFAPELEMELVELDPSPARKAWRRRLQTITLPARAWLQRGRSPNVWHVLDGSRAFVAAALGPAPTMVTVHDIIPWLQAEGSFPGAPALGAAARSLWRGNGNALRTATRVVCVSRATKADIVDRFGVSDARCCVVHHPLRSGLAVLSTAAAPAARVPGLVLHVGNNGFYKNRAGVLRVFSMLQCGLDTRLLMAGPAPDDALLALANELGIHARIEWLRDPDDAALAAAYRRASVLLFPSLYEGFGWPVLEAMAFGLPVVCSDTPALVEVAGDAATSLPAGDEAGLARATAGLLESQPEARAAGARGSVRATAFRVEAFARQMSDAYHLASKEGNA